MRPSTLGPQLSDCPQALSLAGSSAAVWAPHVIWAPCTERPGPVSGQDAVKNQPRTGTRGSGAIEREPVREPKAKLTLNWLSPQGSALHLCGFVFLLLSGE